MSITSAEVAVISSSTVQNVDLKRFRLDLDYSISDLHRCCSHMRISKKDKGSKREEAIPLPVMHYYSCR
jgi:hypothetical protein